MTDQPITETLQGIHFLRDLPEEMLDELATVSQHTHYAPDCVVFRQGEDANTIHLVIEGNVSLEICAPGMGCKRILTVGAGDLLGWSPVLEHKRLTATARTISKVHTVAISGPQLMAICEQNPRLGYEFMKRAARALAKRLNATRLQLLDIFGSEMPAALSTDTGIDELSTTKDR